MDGLYLDNMYNSEHLYSMLISYIIDFSANWKP